MSNEWFYRRTSDERQGPVTVEKIRSLIAAGELQPDHEVWCPGMTHWSRIADVAELRMPAVPAPVGTPVPALPGVAAVAPTGTVSGLPEGLMGWMTFVAVMTLISGALSIMSCFGAPTGILMVIAGVSLLGAKSALEPLASIDPAMLPFLNKLKTFMVMHAIVYILGLLIMAVLFTIYFGVIMAALASGEF